MTPAQLAAFRAWVANAVEVYETLTRTAEVQHLSYLAGKRAAYREVLEKVDAESTQAQQKP